MRDRRRVVRTHLRMGLVLAVPGLLTGLVVAKAFQLQVLDHERLSRDAAGQQIGLSKQRGRRGSIYDRNGVVLAHSAPGHSVSADPSRVEDAALTAKALGKALDLSPKRIRRLQRALARKDRQFAWVRRHVQPRMARAVASLELPGIRIVEESKRYWPLKELAGQVLGMTNLDGQGLGGLEARYEKELSGHSHVIKGLRDARRRLILADDEAGTDPGAGHSVVLTLDTQVQHWLEAEIADAVRSHHAKSGVGVVLDPKSGDILAMANVPRFNPNVARRDASFQRNRAVRDAIEMGSVVKPFTAAGAVAHGSATMRTVFDTEKGRLRIGGFWIRDHERHGDLTLARCIEVSSNVCLAKVAAGLGKEGLFETLRSFGFGEPTGSGVSGEAGGRLDDWSRWSDSRLATASYGYGFTATPLQVATAMAAIANGGKLVRPRLVSALVDGEGRTVQEFAPEVRGQAIPEAVARDIRHALVQVVEGEDGTASRARVPGYTVAGKTGTARKVDPVLGRYVDRFVGTFVGFAPVEDPKAVILVSVDEPKPDYYGGLVAAPAFARTMARVLSHLDVPPTVAVPEPDERGAARAAADGATPSAPPAEEPPGTVPNFEGMTLRRALAEAWRRDLRIEPVGGGRARSQSLDPGTPIAPGNTCRVEFDSVL